MIWRRERDLNPRVHKDTSFPGWLPTELGDPGPTKYPRHDRFKPYPEG